MSNPKKNSKAFVPNHLGTQPKNPTKTNKGKMLDKTGKHPDAING
ncbi:small, acid-soluble spore protein N [Jeotgalibacillus sp. S-D1]|nr:small acid-soluble spore protein N [Jeotgalibacillus sp. S-D1]TDL30918.1 small, acid-soluble spore protein N [Jeotgalibacillus sp. S-D1]